MEAINRARATTHLKKAKNKNVIEEIFKESSIPSIVSKGLFVQAVKDQKSDNSLNEQNDISVNSSSLDLLQNDKKICSYYVMRKYGRNLETIFEGQNFCMSTKTILQIGIVLLGIIEKIHAADYTYNDLKLDNIMVGSGSFSEESLQKLHLIDFGFADKYRDRNGTHKRHDDL